MTATASSLFAASVTGGACAVPMSGAGDQPHSVYYDHRLPAGPMRDRLESLRAGGRLTAHTVKGISGAKDLGSAHWHVHKISTEASAATPKGTPFVARMVKPVGEAPAIGRFLIGQHHPQQNLSRVRLADRAQAVIDRDGLDRLKIAATWVYPLSGDDTALDASDLTDNDVMLVQEHIDELRPIGTLSPRSFDQTAHLACKGNIPDLNSGNVIIGHDTRATIVDMEILNGPMLQAIEQAPADQRAGLQTAADNAEHGHAVMGVCFLGLANGDLNVKMKAVFLPLRDQYERDPVNTIVLCAAWTGLAVLGVRNLYYRTVVSRLVNHCRQAAIKAVNELIKTSGATEATAYEAVRTALAKTAPQEKREEVITGFTTLALATMAKKNSYMPKADCTSFVFFGKKYTSVDAAIKQSENNIGYMWRSDWSVRSKVGRLVWNTGAAVAGLVTGKGSAKATPATA